MGLVSGATGSVTLLTGFTAKINNWTANVDFGLFDSSGFGDNGYAHASPTIARISGSASGIVDDTAVAIPAAVLAATFTPADTMAELILGLTAARTYTFDALISNVRYNTPYRAGAMATIDFDFTSYSAIVQA